MAHDVLLTLKKAGLKVTQPRRAILEILNDDSLPINAEEIQRKLRTTRINLVTVYRTLASLEEAGVVHRVDLRKGAAYYELSLRHHHHITCRVCGKTEDFEACDMDGISASILKKSALFSSVDQHSLELFGVCKKCIRK